VSWAAAVAFLYVFLKAPGLCNPTYSSFELAAFLLFLQVCGAVHTISAFLMSGIEAPDLHMASAFLNSISSCALST
jgi:hypothetical protein